MDTTISTTIKVLNKPNKIESVMKNLARLIISVLLTGLEDMGRTEVYCLGIDLKESHEEEVN